MMRHPSTKLSIGSASDDEASLNETIQKLDTNLPQGKLINRKEQKQKGKSNSVTGLTGIKRLRQSALPTLKKCKQSGKKCGIPLSQHAKVNKSA